MVDKVEAQGLFVWFFLPLAMHVRASILSNSHACVEKAQTERGVGRVEGGATTTLSELELIEEEVKGCKQLNAIYRFRRTEREKKTRQGS